MLCQLFRRGVPLRRFPLAGGQSRGAHPGKCRSFLRRARAVFRRPGQADVPPLIADHLCAQLRGGRVRSLGLPPGQPGSARHLQSAGMGSGGAAFGEKAGGFFLRAALCGSSFGQRTGQLRQQSLGISGRLFLPGYLPVLPEGGREGWLPLPVDRRLRSGTAGEIRGHHRPGAAVVVRRVGSEAIAKVVGLRALCGRWCGIPAADPVERFPHGFAGRPGPGLEHAAVDADQGVGLLPEAALRPFRFERRAPVLRVLFSGRGGGSGRAIADRDAGLAGLVGWQTGNAGLFAGLVRGGAAAVDGHAPQYAGKRAATLSGCGGFRLDLRVFDSLRAESGGIPSCAASGDSELSAQSGLAGRTDSVAGRGEKGTEDVSGADQSGKGVAIIG